MKRFLFQSISIILVVLLLSAVTAFAGTSKYRLSLRGSASTTMVIGWSDDDANVYWGTTDQGQNYGAYPNQVSTSATVDKSAKGMNHHFARLTGLQPDTKYYFVIRSSSTSPRFYFKTAPANGTGFSIIAGGDSRSRPDWRRKGNRLVKRLRPMAILFGGDYTDDDTNDEWRQWLTDWQETISSDGRMYPHVGVIGNHEDDENVVKNIFDAPSQYFSVTIGDIWVGALNTERDWTPQKSWLINELQNNTKTWKIAFYHKPMRPHGDKSDMNGVYDAWARVFYDYRVQLSIDADQHVVKTTYPIRPDSGGEEGFKRDDANGTVYTGEGTWGVSPRSITDKKSWTRYSGAFCQLKWIWVGDSEMILRTVKFDNVDNVASVSDSNPWAKPDGLVTYGGDVAITGGKPVVKNETAFTEPKNNDIVYESGAVAVDVAAADEDGVQRVYLSLNGQELPRSEGAAPYNWSSAGDPELANLPVGSHTLTARAVDRLGNSRSATITIHVQKPVYISSPVEGAVYASGDAVPMVAEATANIDYVKFWLDDGIQAPYIIIVENTPPFSKSAFDLPNGTYSVWAAGVDFDGNEYTSTPVNFTMGDGSTPTPSPTPAPTPTPGDTDVTMTSPLDGSVYASGDAVSHVAEATENIDYIRFWLDDGINAPYVVIVENTPPFSKSAFGLADGSYTAWAVGVDFDGREYTSTSVHFTIGGGTTPTPTGTPTSAVDLTSPVDGAQYPSGSAVPMVAEADAAVTDLVTFWVDNGVAEPYIVIVERVYPYSKSAYNLADGNYTVWAEAAGKDGSTTKSQVVSFTIGDGTGPTPTPGQEINLLQNPGFEEGKVVWSGFESKIWLLSSTAHGGTASARNIGGSVAVLSQTVTLKPNTVYELRAWTRISAGSSGTLIIDTDDLFDSQIGGDFANTKADNVWYEFKGSFNSGSATSVTIRSFTTGFSGTGRIDDLMLTEK